MAIVAVGVVALGIGAAVGALFSSKSTSENVSNETVQGLINVANSAAQSCQVSATQIQSANISGNTGGNINVTENWKQFLILNSECIQSVTFQNNISQLMEQEADQLAKSIAQQFQLASAEAKNVANATADLSIQVSNAFTQNCTGYESQIQTFKLTNNTDVTANVYQNWEQYNSSTFKCVMRDQAVNNTTQRMQQDIGQQAEATVQNFFAVILGMIFAIFALIGIIVFALIFFGVIGTSAVSAAEKSKESKEATSETTPAESSDESLEAEIAANEAILGVPEPLPIKTT